MGGDAGLEVHLSLGMEPGLALCPALKGIFM
jgi:hypothetical protein